MKSKNPVKRIRDFIHIFTFKEWFFIFTIMLPFNYGCIYNALMAGNFKTLATIWYIVTCGGWIDLLFGYTVYKWVVVIPVATFWCLARLGVLQ